MRTFAQKLNQPQRKQSPNLTRSNTPASATSHDAHPLLRLQRTIGNQAVLRLLQPRADGLEAGADNKVGPTTEDRSQPPTDDFSRTPVHTQSPITTQAKFTVNAPGDSYEQEADHIAEQVMRMPEPQPSREHQRLQTKHIGSGDAGQTAAPPIVQEVLDSPGQPLDPAMRGFMEPSFGRDFSQVRVHTDPKAAESARAMDALAFTVGRDVVFASGQYAPDMESGRRLLAHELAHVVQQGAGVPAAVSGSKGQLQRKNAPKPDPAIEQWVVDSAMRVLDDVLDNETSRIIDDSPERYRLAFEKLYQALVGHRLDRQKILGRERRELFDEAILGLAPLLTNANEGQRAKLMRRRQTMLRLEAEDRVENSLIVDNKLVEIPDDRHPREQAAVLRTHLPKLVESMQIANEQLLRLGHEQLEEVLEHLEKGGHSNIVSRLAMLHALLGAANGWLLLTDDELQHHLNNIHGFLPGVATYGELVKAIVEVGIGAVSLTATLAAAILKVTGEGVMASAAMGVAAQAGHLLGNVVAGIEIVHGIVVLLDPKATRAQKERAAFGVVSGGAWFVGKRIGGAAVGAAASFAVVATYLELKVAAYLYWQGALGINTFLMREAFEFMKQNGASMARVSENLARAGILFHEEQNPMKAEPLARIEAENAVMLATLIDWFLQHCLSSGKDMGFGTPNPAGWPGNYPIFVEAFAPLQPLRNAKSGPALASAAIAVIEKITWCLAHAGDIAVAATKGKRLHDVEQDAAKAAKGHEE